MTNSNDPIEYDEKLPVAVAESLRQRFRDRIEIPETVEQAILQDARSHLQQARPVVKPVRQKPFQKWLLAAVSLASAAAVVVTASVSWMATDSHAPTVAVSNSADIASELTAADIVDSKFESSDIDQNGAVDILDAFALARHIEDGQHVNTSWDQNQDGELNDQDVELVARIAVML